MSCNPQPPDNITKFSSITLIFSQFWRFASQPGCMYYPNVNKKSAMIKSNPSCRVRNACGVHFRHRPINSFTFSKSNVFKTLNWSRKFFLFLCRFLFSHPPMKSFPIKLCYTCLIEIQYYVQLQFVFLQVFLLPIASITCSAMLLLYLYSNCTQ